MSASESTFKHRGNSQLNPVDCRWNKTGYSTHASMMRGNISSITALVGLLYEGKIQWTKCCKHSINYIHQFQSTVDTLWPTPMPSNPTNPPTTQSPASNLPQWPQTLGWRVSLPARQLPYLCSQPSQITKLFTVTQQIFNRQPSTLGRFDMALLLQTLCA